MGQRNVVVAPIEKRKAELQEVENVLDTRETLMLKKVLLKKEK